jgi:hypothetical protein
LNVTRTDGNRTSIEFWVGLRMALTKKSEISPQRNVCSIQAVVPRILAGREW